MKDKKETTDARADPVADSAAERVRDVAYAAPLTAHLSSTETNFKQGEPVPLEFSVKNVGDKALKILPWNTPLESRIHADILTIEHNGVRALFVGRKIRRPEATEADYIVIEAGETLRNTVDLSQAYNLANRGNYSVQYTPFEIAGIPTFSPNVAVSVLDSPLSIELH